MIPQLVAVRSVAWLAWFQSSAVRYLGQNFLLFVLVSATRYRSGKEGFSGNAGMDSNGGDTYCFSSRGEPFLPFH